MTWPCLLWEQCVHGLPKPQSPCKKAVGGTSRIDPCRQVVGGLVQALLGWWGQEENLNSGEKVEAFSAKERSLKVRHDSQRGVEGK